MILTEENEYYSINCDKALWASDEQHNVFQKATGSLLKDADWFIETETNIIIVEYKNGKVYKSKKEPFDPLADRYIDSISKKYYDSLHYLTLLEKDKPKIYVYIVEYPNDDSVSRKLLRNRISKKLPFGLQKLLSSTIKLISDFEVVSISEWNEKYSDFPIFRTEKPFKEIT